MTEHSTQGAQEILRQLGGREFLTMTGAHNLSGSETILNMKLRRNASKATGLRIWLDRGTDTYTMDFIRMYKLEVKSVEKIEGVYCDQLREIFERVTGMTTHMPRFAAA